MSLNIALLNDSFPPAIDGVANAVVNYAKFISEKHGDATVITPNYPHVIDNYPFEVCRYSSASLSRKMPYRVGNPFVPGAVKRMSSRNFDLLHVHSPFASSVFASEISMIKRKKIPTILTYHTKYNIEIDKYVVNPHFNKIARSFVLRNIRNADEVWAVSNGTVENLRHIGYHGEIIVMPNGTDFSLGKSPESDIREIDRMYALKNEFIMLFVGRMIWHKNLKIILDALKSLKSDGYYFKAFFVGEGPDRASVEQYARAIGVYDLTIFTGAIYDRDKVKAFFSRADLFLFPSTFDTSGLVVKEAAACGCPSVLARGSCAAEGAEHGISGMLSEENAEDFAKNIAEVMNNPELHQKLCIGAPEHLYTTWESCVDKAVARYYEVLENFNRKKKK